MLYIYHGTDHQKVTSKARALIDALMQKRPDASVVVLESDVLETDLEALIEAQGLFNQRHITLLRWPFETPAGKAAMLLRVEALRESKNIFVVVSPALDAAVRKKVEPHAERVEEYQRSEVKNASFNIFSLGDCIISRDKKGLWVGYQQALLTGSSPEEIHGTLFWALKNILLSTGSTSPEEAGVKAYTYSKSKKAASKYTRTELILHSRSLVRMYHDVRLGKGDLATLLELWVLCL